MRNRRSSPNTSLDGVSSPWTRCLRWAKSSAAARLQADHQRLRRLQPPVAVEQVAQAAAGQVLDDGVHGGPPADLLLAPVVHGGDVRVRQLGHRPHRRLELAPELRRLGDLRTHELDRDRAPDLGVGRRRRSACSRRPTPCARRGSDHRAHGRRDRAAPPPGFPGRSCAMAGCSGGHGLHRRRGRLSLGLSAVAARPCGGSAVPSGHNGHREHTVGRARRRRHRHRPRTAATQRPAPSHARGGSAWTRSCCWRAS